jgi:Protein of unknown function, DUF481
VSMTRRFRQLALLVLMTLFPLSCIAALTFEREKTDVVIMKNGDRITGEIASLQYGIMQLKTSNMGTISIEWPAIRSVESKYTFFVELIGGQRYYGHIRTDNVGDFVIAADEGAGANIPMIEVARLSQVESGFWDRIHGSLAVGYNFTKSSDISISSLNFNTTYRAPHLESTLAVNSMSTKSPDSGTTDREQIAYVVRFVRPAKTYWLALSSLDRNEELGIEGRVQLGGAIGRMIMQRSYAEISGVAGLSFNQEWITGTQGEQSSIEGVLGGEWRVFRFSYPDTTLNSSLLFFPSLTESGRYRSEINVTLSREIIEDLTLELSYYNSYDSDPPNADAASSDYGIVTSLGYKF